VNREQIKALATRGVAARAATLGTRINLDGYDLTAVVSPATPELSLESGGFEKPVDFVVRIAKAILATAPAVGAPVKIEDVTYRVTAIRAHVGPLAQDWVLEVASR
jgi:hypothetical protein